MDDGDNGMKSTEVVNGTITITGWRATRGTSRQRTRSTARSLSRAQELVARGNVDPSAGSLRAWASEPKAGQAAGHPHILWLCDGTTTSTAARPHGDTPTDGGLLPMGHCLVQTACQKRPRHY